MLESPVIRLPVDEREVFNMVSYMQEIFQELTLLG